MAERCKPIAGETLEFWRKGKLIGTAKVTSCKGENLTFESLPKGVRKGDEVRWHEPTLWWLNLVRREVKRNA